jgi:hypothetical protein
MAFPVEIQPMGVPIRFHNTVPVLVLV